MMNPCQTAECCCQHEYDMKSIDIKLFNRKSVTLWLILLFVSTFGMCDFPESRLMNDSALVSWIEIIFICSFKATLLCLMLLLGRQWKAALIAAWLLVVLYVTVCVCNFVSYTYYGLGISNKLVAILAQTNRNEVSEFMVSLKDRVLSSLDGPAFWLCVAGLVAATVIIVRYVKAKQMAVTICMMSAAGLVISIYLMFAMHVGRSDVFASVRVVKTLIRSYRNYNLMSEMMSHNRPHEDIGSIESEKYATNVCVIIGESASRDHLSIYGYPLPTSPRLDSRRDSLFIFSDALASSTLTMYNMERLLSFKSDEDSTKEWWEFPFTVDVFKAAGYRTYWLSNQEKTGIWSNSSYVMIVNSDVIKYMKESSEDHILQRPDGILMPDIKRAFADDSVAKFIGIHLYGSHILYSQRYPEEYSRFTGEDIMKVRPRPWLNKQSAQKVAEYDNSILYTDCILDSIIALAEKSSEPSVVIYLSDHGENVFDDRDYSGRDRKSVRVPFIIYANGAYRRRNPEIVERMRNAADRPFSTANLIYSLLSLSGVSYSYYDPTRDVLSDSFCPRPRYVDSKVWAEE